MPLWGSNNHPNAASTNKPKWLNSGRRFKSDQNPANTYLVSAAEVANTGRGVSPGWVTAQIGTGPVVSVDVAYLTNGGFTVNNNVSVAFSTTQGGSGANGIAQFTAGNLTSILIDNGGSGYNSAPTVTITGGNGNTAAARLTAVMGGRCGRYKTEILVAMSGDITSDDSANDNPIFGA
jgi:hypothetical protein